MRRAIIILVLMFFALPTVAHAMDKRLLTVRAVTSPCAPYNCNDGSPCQTYGNTPYCQPGCSAGRICQITTGVCGGGWPPQSCWLARCVENTSENCGSTR